MMNSRKTGILLMIWSAMSLNAAVWPETYATAGPPRVAAGTMSFRSRPTRLSVAASCGAELGVTNTIATVFSSLNCGCAHRGDVLGALDTVEDPLRRLLVALDVDDDRDRAVEAGPEALGEQVVGAAARLRLGLRPLVGGAEADERRGAGQDESDDQDDREDDLRVARHEPAPARDERLVAGLLRVVERLQ